MMLKQMTESWDQKSKAESYICTAAINNGDLYMLYHQISWFKSSVLTSQRYSVSFVVAVGNLLVEYFVLSKRSDKLLEQRINTAFVVKLEKTYQNVTGSL